MVAWSLEMVQINLSDTHVNLTRLTYIICKPSAVPENVYTAVV